MFPSPLSLIRSANWKDILGKLFLVLLLPVFFILKGYDDNAGLIPVSLLPDFLARYFLPPFFLYIFCIILFGRTGKAAIFSIFLTALYLFFGAFHDFLKNIFHQSVVTSYTFLIPAIIFFVFLIYFLLRRANHSGSLFIRYYTWLMAILIVFQVGSFVYHLFSYRAANNLRATPAVIQKIMDCPAQKKPDIYFIVLDGYTNSGTLREEFKYSNKSLDSLLKRKKFFISTKSKSNYNVTPFSLSSTLDLNYLKPGIEANPFSTKLFLQATQTLKQNEINRFLKDQGYQVKNYGCFDFSQAPAEKELYFKNVPFDQIDNQTFWSRLKRDIGWNFTTQDFFTGKFRLPPGYAERKAYHLERNQYNWEQLITELQRQSDTPRLVYVHMMLPHEPFYLNRDGSLASDTAIIQQTHNLKEGYLNQVIYTNGLLKEVIQLAAVESGRERVVIIEGDHGFRDYDQYAKREKEFMNLNTYYFSDNDYEMLYDSISPVNSFRVILNKYFCQELPLLKDSTIYLQHNARGY